MAKTDTSSRTRREREAARLRAAEAARAEAERRAARRRGLIGIGVVIGVVLAVIGVIKGATSEKERKAAATTTTAPGSPTTAADSRPPASLPTAPPGQAITGPPPCPPREGSAGRVTRFSDPPPQCLDPAVDYTADVRTSKGVITVDLQEDDPKGAANTFVFLARYHYYEGLPFTTVLRGAYAAVADPTEADGTAAPGFRQPATGSRQSSFLTSLLFGLTPTGGTTGGGLTIGMPGDQFTRIPPETSVIGIILDARTDRAPGAPDDQKTVQQLINDTATPSGDPADVTTIEGVDIKESPKR